VTASLEPCAAHACARDKCRDRADHTHSPHFPTTTHRIIFITHSKGEHKSCTHKNDPTLSLINIRVITGVAEYKIIVI